MEAARIVESIRRCGADISLDGNGRILVRPSPELTDEHRVALRANRDAVAAYLAQSYTLTFEDQPITLTGQYADVLARYDAAVLQTARLPRDTVHTVTLADSTGKLLRLAHFPPCREVMPNETQDADGNPVDRTGIAV